MNPDCAGKEMKFYKNKFQWKHYHGFTWIKSWNVGVAF